MALYGALTTSGTGLLSQSYALNVISENVANSNTGGYKASTTQFSTLLSETLNSSVSVGQGVSAYTTSSVSVAGSITTTSSDTDLAINGEGFFVLNTEPDGSGETYYGRDGSFQLEMVEDGDGSAAYLVDKNGYYLMGYEVENGTASSTLSPVIVDPSLYADNGQETSSARLELNLPAGDDGGSEYTYGISMVDSDGEEQSAVLTFTKSDDPNEWTVSIDTGDASDTVNTTTTTLTFDSLGQIVSPEGLDIDIAWGEGSTSSFSIDLTATTQYDNAFVNNGYEDDGFAAAEMTDFYFTEDGALMAEFGSAYSAQIAEIPIAVFTNPDGLTAVSGNVYQESANSGEPTLYDVGETDLASFVPSALEGSNVDIEDEFSRMIMTQHAYSASSQVFQAANEMIQQAANLKA